MMGLTPAAISQKYKRLKEGLIIPYFRENFSLELDLQEVVETSQKEYGSIYVDDGLRCSSITEHSYNNTFDDIDSSAISDKDILLLSHMSQKRTTPEFITELQPDEIFVFGSNLRGMHGGGAALVAYRKFGAIMGQGVGLQGQSYGIPTMQGGVETIRPYVDEFIQFAKDHPELTFLVTRIGCGIAGFDDGEISPLFEKAHNIGNIVLPEGW